MKIKLTILFLAMLTLIFGQTTKVRRDKLNRIRLPNEFDIDSTNDLYYYNQAITLTSYHNYDSSQKAVNMFRSLSKFNEIKYSVSNFQTEMYQIEVEVYNYYKLALSGQWKFEWSGSNWGTDKTAKEVNQKIMFKNDNVYFFRNDTIVRQSKFILENRFRNRLIFNVYDLSIIFNDNNEEWTLTLCKSYIPYIGKSNSLGILINKMPNCVCGCLEEVYAKMLDTNLVKLTTNH